MVSANVLVATVPAVRANVLVVVLANVPVAVLANVLAAVTVQANVLVTPVVTANVQVTPVVSANVSVTPVVSANVPVAASITIVARGVIVMPDAMVEESQFLTVSFAPAVSAVAIVFPQTVLVLLIRGVVSAQL